MPGQGVRGAGAADVINESLVLVLSFKLQTEWALKHHLSRCKGSNDGPTHFRLAYSICRPSKMLHFKHFFV